MSKFIQQITYHELSLRDIQDMVLGSEGYSVYLKDSGYIIIYKNKGLANESFYVFETKTPTITDFVTAIFNLGYSECIQIECN